jgi:hypothetical protein
MITTSPGDILKMNVNSQVPVWLVAAWQRLYALDNNGQPDASVNVRNIQTPTLFGDVRIPKNRPAFPNAKSLADLTDAELATLYPQEGFSGHTTVDGYITTWHHEIDYQPPDGTVDIGRLQFTGGRSMFEYGVQASYTEHWWNLASGDGACFGARVLKRQPGATNRIWEILSVNGDHFIYARNRAKDLPMANSLGDLIKSTNASRADILAYLDCEVSHGFVEGGSQPWEIQFSTLPFRTGQRLAFIDQIVVDPKTGAVSSRGDTPDMIWSFPVNTLVLDDLLVLFPGRPT